MFRIAHISDLHIGPMPQVRWHELLSKRITGYLNWQQRRKHFHKTHVLDNIVAQIRAHEPDHLAITGDLVNIATRAEIEQVQKWLIQNCPIETTSLVPGNHDAYVPGASQRSTSAWRPWIFGNNDKAMRDFPYMKELGDVAIIGFSTSNATLPLQATGKFTENQAQVGSQLLKNARDKGLYRIILIHHPPYEGATHRMKRMLGIGRFKKMLESSGAELILHGHTHLNTSHQLVVGKKTIPVIGTASASQLYGDKKPVAGFNLFDIERCDKKWVCQHKRFALDQNNRNSVLIETNKLVSDQDF